jgi:ubiquinone/menaquinone biosynthesis C-methylase UbiE
LAALAPHPGESVLDIGCGGGETALDLVRAVAPDGTVVGIDLSAAVLAFAQRAAQGCERVRFVQADAEVFPFEPASFDAAFSRFGSIRRECLDHMIVFGEAHMRRILRGYAAYYL